MNRKQAIKRLDGLRPCVEDHLARLEASPGDPASSHHQHECRVWLEQMERAVRHVGKKTAAEWAQWLARCQARLEAAAPAHDLPVGEDPDEGI